MRRSLLFPSVLAVVTVLFIVIIFAVVRQNVQQTETLLDANSLVRHTRDVQRELDNILLTVTEAETGQRGFLLTGNDAELEPYTSARGKLDAAFQQLSDLTTESPPQKLRVARLRAATDARMTDLAQTEAVRRQLGLGPALMMVTSSAGRKAMDDIRRIGGEISQEEANTLVARQSQRDAAYESAIRGRVGSGFVSAVLLVGLAILAFAQGRSRERMTGQIADEREHLAVTLASIGDAVIATDVNGRVTLMNDVAATLTGWPAAEARSRAIHDVFHIISEHTRAEAEIPVDRVIREGAIQRLESRTLLVSRSGEERPIDDSAAPIRAADGSIRGVVLVFRDVSERQARRDALRESEQRYRDAAERERVARAEAEQANRLKDEFLAILSHELRTPLNAVLGWTQILQAGAAPEQTVVRALASIKRNSEAQQRLVDDLLDVSRIVTGKFPLERKPFDLGLAVGTAVDAVRPDAQAKQIDLQVAVSSQLTVDADPYRIQQVAANLLSNAVKFTPAGGRIDVTLDIEADGVALVVRDTGVGIAPALQPHIFDRFRQGDSSRTRAHGGLGLGLAIVKHIVDAHGGSIAVESDGEGRGTAFRVFLPAAVVSSSAGADRQAPRAFSIVNGGMLTGVRLLVVDDEADSLDMLRYALTKAGGTVSGAASGREALDALDRQWPDVMLADIEMPEMDGFELLAEVRRQRGSQAPPVVAITARARVEDAARAVQAGFAAHVAKPVDLNALVAVIRGVLKDRAEPADA